MQIQPEVNAGPLRRRATSRVAFGLPLQVDEGIDIPGISDTDACSTREGDQPASRSPASPLASQAPTRVRLDPRELARRWNDVGGSAVRVRELSDGETALLTVDFARPAGYLLDAPGFGRILISSNGTELICDPEPGSSQWTALLPAQALPLAATLRGFEVLHASGVVLGGKAALFAGPPGAGKSSLAAALLRRGAALLSDDAVALELRAGGLIAHPGADLLQLRAAEHDRLSTREREALGPATDFLSKQSYRPSVTATPAPLGELFLLEHSTEGPAVERIEVIDPFALLASTYNLSVQTPERLIRHLDLAVALAATECIYRLRVQPGTNATELANTVAERVLEL